LSSLLVSRFDYRCHFFQSIVFGFFLANKSKDYHCPRNIARNLTFRFLSPLILYSLNQNNNFLAPKEFCLQVLCQTLKAIEWALWIRPAWC